MPRSTNTLRKERGVSPVIGVILMTAIAVILSATIGSFVLGLGSKITGTRAPQTNFDFEPIDANNDGQIEEIRITHNGGDAIDGDQIIIRGDINNRSVWDGTYVRAGDTATFTSNAPYNDDVIRIVWMSPSDGSSETLAEYTVPS